MFELCCLHRRHHDTLSSPTHLLSTFVAQEGEHAALLFGTFGASRVRSCLLR
jgi:hypothetical protein